MNNRYESKVMWAQMDANQHLRHSAYADFAAQARVEILENMGFDMKTMAKHLIGPILFREELKYLKEIRGTQKIHILTYMTKSQKNGSRWSLRHELYRQDGELSAIIEVDGAWMDLKIRKLGPLPEEFVHAFLLLDRSEDYDGE
ncbi:MAG: acyl-CoA thioesterase [Crocinitomicaceae bacterium]|nr:acyl-CoA thioesterase [Crocinitomicaceae bacterium]